MSKSFLDKCPEILQKTEASTNRLVQLPFKCTASLTPGGDSMGNHMSLPTISTWPRVEKSPAVPRNATGPKEHEMAHLLNADPRRHMVIMHYAKEIPCFVAVKEDDSAADPVEPAQWRNRVQ